MPRRLLMAVCVFAIVPVLAACGDDDDVDGGASPDATNNAVGTPALAVSSASPKLARPASKYSVSIDDIGIAWLTDVNATFVIGSADYGKTPRLFASEAEGTRLLKEWGYEEGYETGYIPEGRETAVLKGSYYIAVETHLFKDEAGARTAFEYFTKYVSTSGASGVPIQALGNQALGYATVSGTIGNTQVKAMYHQVVFLRGNVMTIVLTKGAQGFMKIDSAWEIASIADEKMLGERSAAEPTRTSEFKTPTATPKP